MATHETTLHTFLFHCPAALRSVVLFGSWDNFVRPYPLELYAPKWRNQWKGCFTFTDIICDGETNQSREKREGPLKMGGTYWYYYKVDEDEEVHNPTEPSTAVCPLLPGQRLNVLEVPIERHSRSKSEAFEAFTRNPNDRYLTPVPPAPLRPPPSPIMGGVSGQASYALPLPSPWAPKSATYPPADTFLSPNVVRHVRSASSSPRIPSAPIFADFKGLKEKLASRRSASRTRNSSKAGELEISSPVLVSTTNGDIPLTPLPGFRLLPAITPTNSTSVNVSVDLSSMPTRRREFSPLGSHPIDPSEHVSSLVTDLPIDGAPKIIRRRSHVPSTVVTSEFRLDQGRIRAHSTNSRRTQHYLFSNDPWMSSPKWLQDFDDEKQVVEDDTPPAPILHRPSSFLGTPAARGRPTSSHGGHSTGSLRSMPLEKALPGIPRVMAPLPLHERKPYVDLEDLVAEPDSPTSEITEYYFSENTTIETAEVDKVPSVTTTDEMENEHGDHFVEKSRSHFSTWSSGSLAFSDSTIENESVQSSTFSSIGSDGDGVDSSQCRSLHSTFAELPGDMGRNATLLEDIDEDEIGNTSDDDDFHTPYLSPTPPQLEDLRISTFGSDLFSLDIQHVDSAPRRQAACFGLGFQYSLPEDETTSKTTSHSENALHLESRPSVQRESSMSQLNTLMADFAFLGDSVI
ncbi:hypothetical protein ACN47E_004047 [Coniothyrium glycines]